MSALIKVHCLFRVIFTEKTCKKTGHPGNEVRSHLDALAHTLAKPCYLSLGKSVIYLKPLYYYYSITDTKIKKSRKLGRNYLPRSVSSILITCIKWYLAITKPNSLL